MRLNCFRLALAGLIAVCLLAPASSRAQATDDNCGSIANAYGPFDYRNSPEQRKMVEPHHFAPQVEALIKGQTSNLLAGDIDYTLRAFPNHPRALVSMKRLGDRLKTDQPPAAKFTVECYYLRGIRFQPDDVVVRMLYADFLRERKRETEALQQLAVVRAHAGNGPLTHYNLGLLYADLGAFDEALVEAHKALELGFPRTELKDKLVKAQKWTEPVPAKQ